MQFSCKGDLQGNQHERREREAPVNLHFFAYRAAHLRAVESICLIAFIRSTEHHIVVPLTPAVGHSWTLKLSGADRSYTTASLCKTCRPPMRRLLVVMVLLPAYMPQTTTAYPKDRYDDTGC